LFFHSSILHYRTMKLRRQLIAAAVALVIPVGWAAVSSGSVSSPNDKGRTDGFKDRWVQRGQYRIHVREHPGAGPTIVLMHGYPDNHHLYDRLVPYLRDRHVVVFDFLGWGESDKPAGYDYTFENQKGDLDAVINGLGLDRVVLVVHDASGPAGINWAVEHPQQVAGIVALNTFYSLRPDSPPNPPEAIRLFSDPNFQRLTDHFAKSPREFRWLYDFQVGGFIRNAEVRKKFVPLLYRQFETKPSTLEAFLRLNADLTSAVLANTEREPQLASLTAPVRIAFGELDPYLSPAQGRSLASLFPNSEALTVAGVGHFPQLDAPGEVANVILTLPTTGG
jgi:pimeloyl-ACP methyl ester carboxylesterase